MRTMSYRSEMYREDRHTITNIPESYKGDVAVFLDKREYPSIRVSNFPQKNGKIEADMADYAKLNWTLKDDEITPEFRENYIKILRGELPVWKLFEVELGPHLDPCLNFINEDSGVDEHLFIERVPGLQMMFEMDRADTGKYLLDVQYGNCDETSMVLTEYYSYGRYEIVFDGIGFCKGNPDEEWNYIYITETLY